MRALAQVLPTEVAGVTIPRSEIALRAAALSRAACPDFLFNHCMRTFLFGAVVLNKRNVAFNADEAFVGAALHDLGLLLRYESVSGSFETDGADAARTFASQHGLDAAAADIVWHSVALHDTGAARQYGPEARLVSAGAGSDVDGPGRDITQEQVVDIVAAFPRLQFKRRFTALAIDHCLRRPQSQHGTWLEDLCAHAPSAQALRRDSVVAEISQAPFAE